LVKHYLNPVDAGEYVLLSLVGKMIYFFGALPNQLMVTLVGREIGLNKDPKGVFHTILAATMGLVVVGLVFLGPLGSTTIPLLFGEKALTILPYTSLYVLAIALFTISNVIVSYHLAKKKYEFPTAALIISLVMAAGIGVFHDNIGNIVKSIFFSSVLGLTILSVMHWLEPEFTYVKRVVTDLADLFLTKVRAATSDSKKILVFNWRDTKHIYAGGAEVYIHEMAKKWAHAGHKVTLFSGNDGLSPREETVDGVEVIRRGGFYMVYLWAFIYYMFRFRNRYDVIIDCQNGIPFFTPLYVKEPVFCVMHHVHQEIFRKYLSRPLAFVARFLEKTLMPMVYRHTRFVTVSPSTKSQMEELGLLGAGIDIVHNGVDLKKFKPGTKDANPVVLYLGRLKAYKSVDVLIKAFKKIKDGIPNAKLVIAGFGEEEQPLKLLADSLDVKDVTFRGRVSESEKVRLMQRAWVFVNPSFIEGWGITTIEANACATPVVAANVPGLCDSVQNPHTGFLVEHGNVELFAERIMALIEDQEMRETFSRHAYEWAKNFSWDKTSSHFLSVLSEAVPSSDYVYEKENV
jgi:glycosyltransferase involved in cell wall biosynthesis